MEKNTLKKMTQIKIILNAPEYKEEEKNENNTKITYQLCFEHNGIMKLLKNNLYIQHYCYIFYKDILNQIKGDKGGKCNN